MAIQSSQRALLARKVAQGQARIEKCPSAARKICIIFLLKAGERVPSIRAKAGQLFAITLGPEPLISAIFQLVSAFLDFFSVQYCGTRPQKLLALNSPQTCLLVLLLLLLLMLALSLTAHKSKVENHIHENWSRNAAVIG